MSEALDLLLQGGHVIDPANEIDGVRDIGIKDGVIARVEAGIQPAGAAHTVDLDNLLVTPGLIDMHVHCYPTRDVAEGKMSGSINADAHLLKEGVTTCVDAGSAGADEFEHFRRTVIEDSVCRILAYVNISAPGMGSSRRGIDPEQDLANLDPQRAAATVKEHMDVAVGIKTAHYWTSKPFDAEHPPWASVDRSVEAGELCGRPVMVDFWPRPPERPYADLLLEHLRPGDIHTHVFARQFPIVDDQGRVLDHMRAARERGIWFDLGHGAASFWFRNAARAFADRFPPDSLSTDLHMGNIHGHVGSLLDTMSKYLASGMPIQEAVYRTTVTPARALGRPDLGTLSVGAEADIAVMGVLEGNFYYRDCGWACIDGKHRIECAMTLRKGEIVWDRHGISCPHWREVPADSGYWEVTETPVPVPRLWVDG